MKRGVWFWLFLFALAPSVWAQEIQLDSKTVRLADLPSSEQRMICESNLRIMTDIIEAKEERALSDESRQLDHINAVISEVTGPIRDALDFIGENRNYSGRMAIEKSTQTPFYEESMSDTYKVIKDRLVKIFEADSNWDLSQSTDGRNLTLKRTKAFHPFDQSGELEIVVFVSPETKGVEILSKLKWGEDKAQGRASVRFKKWGPVIHDFSISSSSREKRSGLLGAHEQTCDFKRICRNRFQGANYSMSEEAKKNWCAFQTTEEFAALSDRHQKLLDFLNSYVPPVIPVKEKETKDVQAK